MLTQFQEHEEAWTRADGILEHSNVPQTKVSIVQYVCVCVCVCFGRNLKHISYKKSSSPLRCWKNLSKPDGILYNLIAETVFFFFFFYSNGRTGCPKHYSIAIRYFIVNIIVQVSSDEASLNKERTYINKLNMVLVQVSGHSYLCIIHCLTHKIDIETRLATQLADFRTRDNRI